MVSASTSTSTSTPHTAPTPSQSGAESATMRAMVEQITTTGGFRYARQQLQLGLDNPAASISNTSLATVAYELLEKLVTHAKEVDPSPKSFEAIGIMARAAKSLHSDSEPIKNLNVSHEPSTELRSLDQSQGSVPVPNEFLAALKRSAENISRKLTGFEREVNGATRLALSEYLQAPEAAWSLFEDKQIAKTSTRELDHLLDKFRQQTQIYKEAAVADALETAGFNSGRFVQKSPETNRHEAIKIAEVLQTQTGVTPEIIGDWLSVDKSIITAFSTNAAFKEAVLDGKKSFLRSIIFDPSAPNDTAQHIFGTTPDARAEKCNSIGMHSILVAQLSRMLKDDKDGLARTIQKSVVAPRNALVENLSNVLAQKALKTDENLVKPSFWDHLRTGVAQLFFDVPNLLITSFACQFIIGAITVPLIATGVAPLFWIGVGAAVFSGVVALGTAAQIANTGSMTFAGAFGILAATAIPAVAVGALTYAGGAMLVGGFGPTTSFLTAMAPTMVTLGAGGLALQYLLGGGRKAAFEMASNRERLLQQKYPKKYEKRAERRQQWWEKSSNEWKEAFAIDANADDSSGARQSDAVAKAARRTYPRK